VKGTFNPFVGGQINIKLAFVLRVLAVLSFHFYQTTINPEPSIETIASIDNLTKMSQSEKTPAATQQPTYAEQQYPPQSQHDITQAPPQYYQPAVAQDRSNGSPAPSPAPQQSEQQQQPPQDQTKSAQAGFHPQTQPGVNMVPGVVPLNQLGDTPQWIDCPFCQKRTQTRLDKEGTPMQMYVSPTCLTYLTLATIKQDANLWTP